MADIGGSHNDAFGLGVAYQVNGPRQRWLDHSGHRRSGAHGQTSQRGGTA